MLVLRSVCRHFRAVTADLDFWYDPDFLFADLATPQEYYSSFMRYHQEERFLKVLFTDASLVSSLGRRKTDWKFESLEGLIAVIEGVPLFMQNARVIHLEMPDYDEIHRSDLEPSSLDIAIEKLAACSHITTLSIRLADDVNLDAIAASFPSLETLKCYETGRYYGSLQELNRLQILRVGTWSNDVSTTLLPWLPVNSAETLTELRLECGSVGNPVFNTNSLDTFINLKSLDIGPLCESICDFIIRARIRLDIFETSIIRQHVPIDKFVDMLRAECLRDLKEFGLTNFHDDTSDRPATEHYWSLILDAFTSMLPSVEEVQLGVPLNLRCCPYFARMVNLKILNWDGTTNPYFGCGRGNDPKAKVQKALDAAFANFIEKPQFDVHLI